MATKIVIDAGHGGYDNGASFEGRNEKDDTLRLALAVGNILSQRGYEVVYTRVNDVYNSPVEKAQIGNASCADYFVSIHRNSSPYVNQYSGVETLVYDNSGIKAEMAENVNAELEKLGFKNIGVSERPGLAVLRRTDMPAILVEAGFINNVSDNALFDNQFENIAVAIANGITETVSTSQNNYKVQVGLYRRYGNALFQLNEIIEDGFTGEIVNTSGLYGVWVGNENSLAEARQLEQRLQALGYDTLIVKQ